MNQEAKLPGSLIGKVVSNKASKTCVVKIVRKVKHHYGKFIKKTTTLYVHDENEETKKGDRILVKPSRPLSKLKRWTLVKVLEKSVLEE